MRAGASVCRAVMRICARVVGRHVSRIMIARTPLQSRYQRACLIPGTRCLLSVSAPRVVVPHEWMRLDD